MLWHQYEHAVCDNHAKVTKGIYHAHEALVVVVGDGEVGLDEVVELWIVEEGICFTIPIKLGFNDELSGMCSGAMLHHGVDEVGGDCSK